MQRPRRTVDEIVQLHRRERGLQREVFVEGLEDKYFYQSFLASQSLGHVAVLEISSVEIPFDAVQRVGCKDGNKGRVIALAALLEGRVAVDQVVCVADADSDYLIARVYGYSLLLLTDYTSIELYLFNKRTMTRVLSAFAGFPKDADEVMAQLAPLLEEAFYVRVAGELLGLAAQETTHSSFCFFDKETGVTEFNSWDYACHMFQPNTDRSWQARLRESLVELRTKGKPDPRFQIRGHDFRWTLPWYIRKHSGFGPLSADTVSRMLLGFADPRDLSSERLFAELIWRLTT